jgi:hypothetical protein
LNRLSRNIESVCIVGHGPSSIKKRADWIDAHDFVIRQKHRDGRCDAMVGSWNQLRKIEPELWIFIDSRFPNLTEIELQAAREQFGAQIDKPLCDRWNEIYRNKRTPMGPLPDGVERKRSSDDLGHLHMSSGLHALLYACHWLKPELVNLVGYDNVQSGGFTWSITRGPDWTKYPDHRWDIENLMIDEIASHYDVEVVYR